MIDDINIYSKKFGTGRYYPVVRIPKSIRDILEKYPYYYRPEPVRPYSPTKPKCYSLYLRKKDYKKWLNSLSKSEFEIFKQYSEAKIIHKNIISEYCNEIELPDAVSVLQAIGYFILIAFFTLIGVVGTIKDGLEKSWFCFIPIAILVGIILWRLVVIIKTMFEYIKERSRDMQILVKYMTELKDYAVRFEAYKIAYDKYKKELNEYNYAIQNKITNPDIYNKRQYAYKNISKTVRIEELTYDEITAVKKGRAECYLYNEMLNYYTHDFPFDIYINVKIESTQDKGNVYFPDFLLCSNDGKIKNIYYDIEIDEPYVQSTGEPIHCEDMDCSRDDFFSDNDIIVIRFAESQIFQYPYACARYIIELHKNIISMSDRPKLVRCGFKVERWSRELSIEWSKIHYRDTYTPSILYFDHYNLTYNNDNWRLISTSQLDKKDIEEISEIKAVRWYSKKCLLISTKSGEQRYIDINPGHPFHEGEDVETIDLRIETYINKNNERMYLVGHYIDETFINTHFKTVNTNATKGQKDI